MKIIVQNLFRNLFFQKMKLLLCLAVLVTIVSVYVCDASYLGYGGVVGDLTPRTGSTFPGSPSTNFRFSPGNYAGFSRQSSAVYPRVRREQPAVVRAREGRFNRNFGSGWRQSPGAGGGRGSYPRTGPASSSYGR